MNSIKLFSLFLGLLLLSGCNKETIDPPAVSVPLFKVEGFFNNEVFKCIVGNDDYKMLTYTNLQNGVACFSGSISNDEFEISLGLFDGNIDILPATIANFQLANFHFAQKPIVPLAILSKNMFTNEQSISQIKWYVNNQFKGINDVSIFEPGKYSVRAQVTFFDGTQKSLTNDIILGYTKNATCSINYAVNQNEIVQVSIENETVPIDQINWYVNNQFYSSQFEFSKQLGDDLEEIKAEIVFENGVKRTKSFLISNVQNWKYLNDFSAVESIINNLNWDYNFIFAVKKDGKTYESITTQNSNASIDVTDFKYYGKNENGKKVYSLNVSINCMVKEVGSQVAVPLNFTSIFGIEIDI
jgi:hypothetical protein